MNSRRTQTTSDHLKKEIELFFTDEKKHERDASKAFILLVILLLAIGISQQTLFVNYPTWWVGPAIGVVCIPGLLYLFYVILIR